MSLFSLLRDKGRRGKEFNDQNSIEQYKTDLSTPICLLRRTHWCKNIQKRLFNYKTENLYSLYFSENNIITKVFGVVI